MWDVGTLRQFTCEKSFLNLLLRVCYSDMRKNPIVEVRKDAFTSLEKLKNL